jgi:hypothetical protein
MGNKSKSPTRKKKETSSKTSTSPEDEQSKTTRSITAGTPKDISSPPSLSTSLSNDSNVFNNDEAAASKLKKHMRMIEIFSIKTEFHSSKLFNKDNLEEVEMKTIIDKLLSYSSAYASWNRHEDDPLHPPSRIYGFIWDEIPIHERSDLREGVIERYLTISTLKRESFEPILKEAKKLAPLGSGSASEEINRMKLISMNSKEIPMSGTKLTKQTSPLELAVFVDSMKRAVVQRPNWLRALTIKLQSRKKKKEVFLLTSFRDIDLDTLKSIDFHKSTTIKDASIAMYEALSATMSNQFRGEMRLYKDLINNQGPKLLWHILHKLTLKHTRVTLDIATELDSLKEAFVDSNYDVHKICPVLYDRLMNFKDAGGNIDNQYILVSSAILSCHVDSLTSMVREWEQKQMRNEGKKCIFELLQAVPNMVDDLVASNEWPHRKLGKKTFSSYLPKDRIPKKPKKDESDITSFLGKFTHAMTDLTTKTIKANQAFTKQLAQGSNSNNKRKQDESNPPPSGKGKFAYCSDRWGPNCHFKNEADFKKFYQGHGVDKSQSYMLDGMKWSYCHKCQKMGNHPTHKHNDNHRSNKRKRNNPRANQATIDLPPLAANHSQLPPTAPAEIEDTNTFDADDDASIQDASDILASDDF